MKENSDFSKFFNKILLAKYFEENSQELLDDEVEILGTWSEKIEERHFDQKLDLWRKSLNIGMKVQVYDNYHWYPSYIIDKQIKHEGEQNIQLNIGYRLYHPEGSKVDEKGSFYGWSHMYDEWLTIQSYPERILPMLVFEASQGELDFVKYLMEEVEFTLNDIKLDVEKKRCTNELENLYNLTGTPLYAACEAGKYDIAKYLIERNADLEIKKDDQSPLMIAIINNHPQIVELLLEKGAILNLESQDEETQQKLQHPSQEVQNVITNFQSTQRIMRILKYNKISKGQKQELQAFEKLNKNLFQMIVTQYI
eukprot:403370348